MNARPFDVRLPLERAWVREAMFAVELLDPVTLARVARGVTVTAVGLAGAPIVNFGELFVWLKEPLANFRKLVIEPGTRPFERMEIAAAQVQRPLHTVELKPLANYPFAPGVTVIRGSLYEKDAGPGTKPSPIPGAAIRLAWLHEDNVTWLFSAATAVTNANGDFTAILRLAPDDVPAIDAARRISIRLFARRAGGGEKHYESHLPHGRVADRTYAWDQMV